MEVPKIKIKIKFMIINISNSQNLINKNDENIFLKTGII